MRFSVGRLGVFIALVTAIIWSAVGPRSGGVDDGPLATVSTDVDGVPGQVVDASALVDRLLPEPAAPTPGGDWTVGKKLMRIRVIRLDGEPITLWDANRQAIHDRIVGTVVVVDGAEKVSDWESAL
jgi:uncharacterized RDD family membrane protein YckC